MNLKDLHQQAEQKRENEEYIEALKLYDEVLIGYQSEKNYGGFSEALQGKVLTFKHLYLTTHDWVFMLLAKHDAEASLKIAEKYGIGYLLASCHFRLGEITMLETDFLTAQDHYQEALALFKGAEAEKGDYTYHLGEVVYKTGKKNEGKEQMLNGLRLIQENRSGVDEFLANVWESGAEMRLAECLMDDSPDEAKTHLEEARKIIESDSRLIIRKRQYEELTQKF